MTKPEFYIYLVSALDEKGFTSSRIKKEHRKLYNKYRRLVEHANSGKEMACRADDGLREIAALIGMEIEIKVFVEIRTKTTKSI